MSAPSLRCKRLAITIAGAVSLGSYEAGVLFEVIRALGEHNEVVGNGPERIEIDVLTGASAGGMTTVIAAQRLLYEADAFKDPYKNPLYDPWVAEVDLDGLLPLQPGDRPKPGESLEPAPDPRPEASTRSILSSNRVEELGRKYITC